AQHYIPKFYLKGFTDKEGALWVYEKFKSMRKSKPKHEAHRPDYYTHSELGKRDETAEDLLKVIESKAAPIVCKLANPQYELTPTTVRHLLMFVGFMFVRVPNWREHMDGIAVQVARNIQLGLASDRARFHKSCAEFEKDTGETIGDYEEMRQYVLKGDFKIEQKSTAFNICAMFMSGLDLIEQLQTFGYQVLYAPNGKSFWTSDSPVFTLIPDRNGQATVGMGFGWRGVEAYFPLNKRACLMLRRGIQPSSAVVESGHLEQINRLTMATATRYLYSPEGYRRIARLFDEGGSRVRPGKESFLQTAPSHHGLLSAQPRKR
ncbi:MAG: DUF4238 domain-containing protein, partial [Candidatus Acidiferrum sp.]